jgi:hypothetical protein
MAAAAVVITATAIVVVTVILVAAITWCSSDHPAHSLVAIMTELTQFDLNSGLLIFCCCD